MNSDVILNFLAKDGMDGKSKELVKLFPQEFSERELVQLREVLTGLQNKKYIRVYPDLFLLGSRTAGVLNTIQSSRMSLTMLQDGYEYWEQKNKQAMNITIT